MARCCATFVGEAIGYLILTQSQEDAPTIIEGTLRGLKPVSKVVLKIMKL